MELYSRSESENLKLFFNYSLVSVKSMDKFKNPGLGIYFGIDKPVMGWVTENRMHENLPTFFPKIGDTLVFQICSITHWHYILLLKRATQKLKKY